LDLVLGFNYGKITSMDSQRRQEPRGRLERQGESLGKKARHELETSPARRRQQARLLLRKDDWDEEETYQREDGERPELSYQQKPEGLEVLI
jgi:hypothetical protein